MGLFSSVGLFSGDCSNRPGQYTLLTVWENTKVLACTLYAISWIVVTFPRRSSMSPKGECCSVWRMLLICWMLPLATHCHTHYHLHPFHFFGLLRNKLYIQCIHHSSWALYSWALCSWALCSWALCSWALCSSTKCKGLVIVTTDALYQQQLVNRRGYSCLVLCPACTWLLARNDLHVVELFGLLLKSSKDQWDCEMSNYYAALPLQQ